MISIHSFWESVLTIIGRPVRHIIPIQLTSHELENWQHPPSAFCTLFQPIFDNRNGFPFTAVFPFMPHTTLMCPSTLIGIFGFDPFLDAKQKIDPRGNKSPPLKNTSSHTTSHLLQSFDLNWICNFRFLVKLYSIRFDIFLVCNWMEWPISLMERIHRTDTQIPPPPVPNRKSKVL